MRHTFGGRARRAVVQMLAVSPVTEEPESTNKSLMYADSVRHGDRLEESAVGALGNVIHGTVAVTVDAAPRRFRRPSAAAQVLWDL